MKNKWIKYLIRHPKDYRRILRKSARFLWQWLLCSHTNAHTNYDYNTFRTLCILWNFICITFKASIRHFKINNNVLDYCSWIKRYDSNNILLFYKNINILSAKVQLKIYKKFIVWPCRKPCWRQLSVCFASPRRWRPYRVVNQWKPHTSC